MSLYEMQAARIETVLSAYKVPARVWQATVTPRFVRYDVTTALGTRVSAVERLDAELALALGAQAVRVYRAGGVLHVEVPREASRLVDLVDLLARVKPTPSLCGVLGVDQNGTPLLIRMDSPDVAHILIAGTTGSGKTALLRSLLASLAARNRAGTLQFVLVDPKGYALLPLADLPHVRMVARTSEETAAALAWLVAEMERRGQGALPHIVLALDELAETIMVDANAVTMLTRLTQRGREAGIHVIAATQRPAATLIGGMVKANFPVRVVGSVASPEDAKLASGLAGTGAERLLGRGDFVLVAKGQMIRFQAAHADDAALAALVDSIGRVPREQRRLLPLALPGGVGSGVGIEAPEALFSGVPTLSAAHPTTPPTRRIPLRERHTPEQLREFLAAKNGKLKAATKAAFGYSDPPTLAIMREAAAEEQIK